MPWEQRTKTVIDEDTGQRRTVTSYVWVAPTTSTQNTARTRTPAKKKKKRTIASKKYTFGGRTYTSYAAYSAARNAYLIARRRLMADAANQKKLIGAKTAAAEKERLRKEAERTAATWQSKYDAHATSAKAKVEADKKAKTRQAYEALKRRSKQLAFEQTDALKSKRTLQTAEAQRRDMLAREYASDENQSAMNKLDKSTQRKFTSYGEVWTSADQRRRETIDKAIQSNKWGPVYDEILQKQKDTDGRYLDRDLLKQVNDEVSKAALAAQKTYISHYNKLIKARNKFLKTKDPKYAKLFNDMLADKEYNAARKNYVHWYGEGTNGGALEKLAGKGNEISLNNDEYFDRTVFGGYFKGSAYTKEELDAKQADIDKLLTRTRTTIDGQGKQVQTEYKLTMNEWLKEVQDEEQARMREAFGRWNSKLKVLRREGYDIQDRDGKMTVVDPREEAEARAYRRQFLAGGLTEENLTGLLESLQNGGAVDRDRSVRALLQASGKGFDSTYGSGFAPAKLLADKGSREWSLFMRTPEGQKYRDAQETYQKKIYKFLTGADKPDGPLGALYELGNVPVVSEVIKGLGIAAGGVGLAFRGGLAAASGGGQLVLPDVNLDKLYPGNWGRDYGLFTTKDAKGNDVGEEHGLAYFDTSPEAQEAERRSVQDQLDLGGPAAFLNDPVKFLEGVSAYGATPARGNTALLLSAALDPTIGLSVGRFLGAGRLATTRAAGLGRTLSLGSVKDVALDASRLALPKALGGAGIDAYKNRLLLASVSKKIGRFVDDWSQLDEADQLALAADLVKAKNTGQVKSILGKVFKRDPVNSEQILAEVQRYAKTVAGQRYGVVATDAVELAKEVARTTKSLERAERIAKSSVAEGKRVADEAKGARALEIVRGKRETVQGVPTLPRSPSPAVTVAQVRARGRLERRYQDSITERVNLAHQAANAAKILRESDDFALRGQAAKDLRQALGSLDAYEDTVLQTPHGPQLVAGVVRRNRDLLDSFDSHYGTSPKPPGFVGVTRARITGDEAFLRQELTLARTRLASATTPGQKAFWTRRMRSLGAAARYLDMEHRLATGADTVAQKVVREHLDEAKEAIAPSRIATKAISRAQAREELGRAVHKRLADIESVGATPNIPVSVTNSIDQVIYDARNAPVDWNATPDLQAVRAEIGDVDLWVAVAALREASGGHGPFAGMYDQALLDLEAQFTALMRTQFPASVGMNDFFNIHNASHNVSATMSLREYRALDSAVQAAVERARNFAMKGTVKLKDLPPSTSATRRLGTRDTELAVIAAKIEVLVDRGWSVAAYDEARGALGDINVRYNVGTSLRREAGRVARRTGGSVDEAFLAAREARRVRETRYNLEAFAARPEMAGLSADEVWLLFEETFLDTDLLPNKPLVASAFQDRVLRQAFKDVSGGIDATDTNGSAMFLQRTNAPPLGNRTKMREWLVENGFWSPRTADQIREGKRVWSIDEERKFWESSYGYTPPWTDEAVLRPLLDDPQGYADALREWGFFEDEFDMVALGQNLREGAKHKALAFGSGNIKRGRTREELREWFYERYGKLVSDDGGVTFKTVPWLMEVEREYVPWLRNLAASGTEFPRLMQRGGLVMNRELLRPDQIIAFNQAMANAVERRLGKWLSTNGIADEFLPQEQLLFAYDVVNELMLDVRWRDFFGRVPAGQRLLGFVGSLMRFPTVWNPAFPIMNIIDRIGFKPWIINFTSTFGKFRRWSERAKEVFPDAESLPGNRSATWYLRDTGGFAIAKDAYLPFSRRFRGFVEGAAESPLGVSKTAEDSLRVNFARSVYTDAFEIATKNGADEVAADLAARSAVKDALHVYFPGLDEAGDLEKALNQIIPFFSYNMRNKLLGLRLALGHPWLYLTAEKFGDMVEARNRELWAEEHGEDVPFPEDGKSRQLWIGTGDGTFYTIDFGGWSDYFRGMSVVNESGSYTDMIKNFFRIPHPTQEIWLAYFFGYNDGKTPWGKEATLGDISFVASVFEYLSQTGQYDPENPKHVDGVQFLSKMLFWQSFGRVDPIKAKSQWFFFLMEQNPDDAWQYYNDNPDLQQYFSLDGTEYKLPVGTSSYSWFANRSDEQRAEYDTAIDGWNRLKQKWDDTLDQWYTTPWADEYKQAKALRRAELAKYLNEHPILGDSWAFYKDTQDWIAQMDEWIVDGLVDDYFAMDAKKPTRDQFKTELQFQKALAAFYKDKKAFLAAHPEISERLAYSRNAAEAAWKAQQLHWAEILEGISATKIRILEEQAKDKPDYDLISMLYDSQSEAYLQLNAESFDDIITALGNDVEQWKKRNPGDVTDRLLAWNRGQIPLRLVVPGAADRYRDGLLPEEQQKYDADTKYHDAIAYASKHADSGGEFYDILRKRGYLERYWEEHPDKRMTERDMTYYRLIDKVFRESGSGKEFYANLRKYGIWDDYMRLHPDKKAKFDAGREYFTYMQTWVGLLKGKKWDEAEAYFNKLPAWARQRYFSKHPKREKAFQGSAYVAAMGRWVGFLKKKDYDGAKKYFDNLPAWMKDRYYDKHPRDRARNELDNEVLRMGAEYFLATGATKLAILRKYPELRAYLKEHGGKEEEFRGLLMSIYRAIPKEDAWMRRKLTEQYPEIFSDEAEGARTLRKIAKFIAEHPDFEDEYEEALKMNYEAYREQLKHEKVAPKPLQMERKKRLRQRRRRRAADFHSSWKLHSQLR